MKEREHALANPPSSSFPLSIPSLPPPSLLTAALLYVGFSWLNFIAAGIHPSRGLTFPHEGWRDGGSKEMKMEKESEVEGRAGQGEGLWGYGGGNGVGE